MTTMYWNSPVLIATDTTAPAGWFVVLTRQWVDTVEKRVVASRALDLFPFSLRREIDKMFYRISRETLFGGQLSPGTQAYAHSVAWEWIAFQHDHADTLKACKLHTYVVGNQ